MLGGLSAFFPFSPLVLVLLLLSSEVGSVLVEPLFDLASWWTVKGGGGVIRRDKEDKNY